MSLRENFCNGISCSSCEINKDLYTLVRDRIEDIERYCIEELFEVLL